MISIGIFTALKALTRPVKICGTITGGTGSTPATAGTSKFLSHRNGLGDANVPAGAYDFEIWHTDANGGTIDIIIGAATFQLLHGQVFNYEKYRNLVANVQDTAPAMQVNHNGVTWRGYFWYPSTSAVTTGNI